MATPIVGLRRENGLVNFRLEKTSISADFKIKQMKKILVQHDEVGIKRQARVK
jgi:hypothetical protein